MTILAIIVAVVLGLVVLRFVTGLFKLGIVALIAIIVVGGIYFLMNFQVHG